MGLDEGKPAKSSEELRPSHQIIIYDKLMKYDCYSTPVLPAPFPHSDIQTSPHPFAHSHIRTCAQ
jgi:hypothetical protein